MASRSVSGMRETQKPDFSLSRTGGQNLNIAVAKDAAEQVTFSH